jgi:hypothetical protein
MWQGWVEVEMDERMARMREVDGRRPRMGKGVQVRSMPSRMK